VKHRQCCFTWNTAHPTTPPPERLFHVKQGYFVTGTGTGVGKTFVTAALARRARQLALLPAAGGRDKLLLVRSEPLPVLVATPGLDGFEREYVARELASSPR
jgi:Mrp family chromosome partitioning ATPase